MKLLGTAAVMAILVTAFVSGCGGSSTTARVSLPPECKSSAGKALLPLECDFSTGNCAPLETYEDEFGQGACGAEGYQIVVKKPLVQVGLLNLQQPHRTLRVATSAVQQAGPRQHELHGVFCRASDTVSYLLGIGSDGSYAIVKWNTELGRRRLLEAGSRPGAAPGKARNTSRIQGLCLAGGQKPSTLALYVGGSLVTAARDAEGPGRFVAVGMFAASAQHGAAVRFATFSARAATRTELEAPTRLVVDDDFSDPRSGWANSTGDFTTQYAEGRYRLRARGPAGIDFDFEPSTRALSIEADMIEVSGPRRDESHGILCGVRRGFVGYGFEISPAAGSYRITRLGRVLDSLATGTIPEVLRGVGMANHVRIICIGGGKQPASLILSVNGKTVARVVDRAGSDEFAFIQLSVATSGEATEVLFDDLVAARLTRQQAAAHAARARPTARPGTDVLFQDDFGGSTALWLQSSDSSSATGHEAGRYRIFIKRPDSGVAIISDVREPPVVFAPPVAGLRIEVAARERPGHNGGSFGVICVRQAPSDAFEHYEFEISPKAGSYVIRRVGKNLSPRVLARGTGSPVVKGGRPTKLIEGSCLSKPSGTTVLALRVNGKLVAKARDRHGIPRFDRFGFTVASGDQNGEDVLFDDLLVREP